MFFAAQETFIGSPPQETLSKLPELAALIRLRAPRVHRIFARYAVRTSKIALFGALCMLFFSIFSVLGAELIGPLGIFLLAVVGIASVAALLTKVGDRIGIPLLSLVILWALALSYFDLTDNHEVALSSSNHPRLERSIEEFKKWYSAREDRKWYEERKIPYPVFMVAASGGGLYAAQHVATVLSRIQDRCPNFAQHVFAISGVSGGSLGGAVFSSMAKAMAPNAAHADCSLGMQDRGKFETTADGFMSQDFLSPVLAAGLFPDAAQRFLPSWSSRFDRARVFEKSISDAWARSKIASDVWSQPYLNHCMSSLPVYYLVDHL
jgi:hypothetical protein